ncbi:MAG: hypothetical protein F6J97_21430 [Leptolyngbya sp. SIO4C1]|nr:hypothetical protein [Leptolyngbya sp. SIO4C1]
MTAGAALALSACTGGTGGGSSAASPQADQLVIQPIQVCDDLGSRCAQINFFEAVADKLWAQAGLEVTFLSPNRLNDSTYLSIAPGSSSSSEFYQLSFSGGRGAFGRHPNSTRDRGPINLWFVDEIEVGAGLVQYGNAWIDANGVLISDDIFEFNNGTGRIDVIAHEVGHNLGLSHSTLGAGPANNLMSGGGRRAIPNSIDDIFPDGAELGQLTEAQIREARRSSFLLTAAELASINTQLPDQVSHQTVTAAADVQATASADSLVSEADAIALPLQVQLAAAVNSRSPKLQPADDARPVSVPEPSLSLAAWIGLAGIIGSHSLKRRSVSAR